MSKISARALAAAEAAEGGTAVLGHDGAIEEVQDCEPYLEHNRMLQGIAHNRKADFRHQAHIPVIWLSKWLHEELDRGRVGLTLYGKEFWETVVQEKLKDPENKWMLAGPEGSAYKQGHKF